MYSMALETKLSSFLGVCLSATTWGWTHMYWLVYSCSHLKHEATAGYGELGSHLVFTTGTPVGGGAERPDGRARGGGEDRGGQRRRRHGLTSAHHALKERNALLSSSFSSANTESVYVVAGREQQLLTLSMQGLTPTIMESPNTLPSLDRAFLACSLDWYWRCIQLPGDAICQNIIDSSVHLMGFLQLLHVHRLEHHKNIVRQQISHSPSLKLHLRISSK